MRAAFTAMAGLALLAGAVSAPAEETQSRIENLHPADAGAPKRPASPRAGKTTFGAAAFSSGRVSAGRGAASSVGAAPRSASVGPSTIAPSYAGGGGFPARSLGYTTAPGASGVAPVMGGTPIQPDPKARVGSGVGLGKAEKPDAQPSGSGSTDDPLSKILTGIGNIFKSMADMLSN